MQRTHQTSPTSRGGERRRALLDALEELLAERPLAEIDIAHISERAGVARSGFYFYFPTKADAVAALLDGLFDQTMAFGAAWFGAREDPPADRMRSSLTGTVGLWEREARQMVALLDAAATSVEVRGALDAWLDAFRDQVATRIQEEQAAGLAAPATDARALARLLLGMNMHALEHHVRGLVRDGAGMPDIAEALAATWTRAIYG